MSRWFTTFVDTSSFFLLLTALCAMFSLALEKRDRFWVRFLTGLLTGTLISGFIPSESASLFPIELFLAALFIFWCRNVTFQDSLYCAVCAYATQHFGWSIYDLFCRVQGLSTPRPSQAGLAHWVINIAVYILFYWLFARRLADGKRYYVDVKHSIFSAVLVLVVVLVLNQAGQSAYVEEGKRLYFICRAYAMFCCAFFLGMQVSQVRQAQLQAKLAFERQLAREQQEQYELTRETIDLINRKCHDLKHQVAALRTCVPEAQRERYLSELERCVQIYDSTLKTGSEILDTVLTEKSLYCEAHQITMTCIADGERLSFMDPMDIFTIFGNAIDNAIESVSKVPDPEKRVISVSVQARSGLIVFQFENYYEHELSFMNGLPQTTKLETANHGFGLRSIRYTVGKYGGFMTIHPENNLFLLCISIPIPEL